MAAVMPIIFSIIPSVCIKWFCARRNYAVDLYPLLTIIIPYYLIHNGYNWERSRSYQLLHGGKMKNIIFTANVIGLTMMGALSASYVTLSTPLEFSFSGEARSFSRMY